MNSFHRKPWSYTVSFGALAFACWVISAAAQGTIAEHARGASDRIQLKLDTTEAERVLDILALRRKGKAIPDDEWLKLFATAPYQRLKEREATIGRMLRNPGVAFSDDDFKRFVLSDELLSRASALSSALDHWKSADLTHDGLRLLGYLPVEAALRAKVYLVIKPKDNSFVWETAIDPTVFVWLDPEMSREQFANTVMHELHHIGLGSVGRAYDKKIAALPEPARMAAGWMGAFGEGMAMLAAAGGSDVDPHAASTPTERARWQQDMARFNDDLQSLNQFFLDVLNGKFTSSQAQEEKARSFYGVQGPWYTVGYQMAVMVETRLGRPALIATMLDSRCLLAFYNQAAAESNAAGKGSLPLWSADLLSAIQASACVLP